MNSTNQQNNVANQLSNGFGIASLVLSILGFLTAFLIFGIFLDIFAIILGIISILIKKQKSGFGLAGIIISVISMLLTILIFYTISSSSDHKTVAIVSDTSINAEAIESSTIAPNDNESQNDIVLSIDEQIIYNDNNVIIKVTGIEENSSKIFVNFYIENNSDLNLGFYAHSYAINGIMSRNNIYDMDYDVASGKKANTSLEIKKSLLDEYEIRVIKYIDIMFWAYDNDKYFKEFETGQLQIKTNLYDETNIKFEGTRIYDVNGISVDFLSTQNNTFTYCVSNNTGQYFDFDVKNISLNDYTLSDLDFDLINNQLLSNCQIIITVQVKPEFLKQNNINIINKVEFSLDISPLGEHYDSFDTEVIITNL